MCSVASVCKHADPPACHVRGFDVPDLSTNKAFYSMIRYGSDVLQYHLMSADITKGVWSQSCCLYHAGNTNLQAESGAANQA